MKILDRYILWSLVQNYLIGMAVMLSLYVLLDMFINMDEFTKEEPPLGVLMGNIVAYYTPNVMLYFSQLSAVITSYACLATLAKLRTQGELTALLSSGVSLYRVAAPVFLFGMASSLLLLVDTELMIPSVAHRLSLRHEDVGSKAEYEVLFVRDESGRLLSAAAFYPDREEMRGVIVLGADEAGSFTLQADAAVWEPSGDSGRWRLERGRERRRITIEQATLGPRTKIEERYPRYLDTELTPRVIQARQSLHWVQYLSFVELSKLESNHEYTQKLSTRVKHQRVTLPISSMVMLLLGIPFFLQREQGQVLTDGARCLGLCGFFFVVTFLSHQLQLGGDSPLPYWLPIFLFGTFAVILLDRVKT